jgi:hypothetical protein
MGAAPPSIPAGIFDPRTDFREWWRQSEISASLQRLLCCCSFQAGVTSPSIGRDGISRNSRGQQGPDESATDILPEKELADV